MKIFKKVLLVLAILIAIPLIVALFVKKEYTVQREVTINQSKEEVFNYVKYIKNQENYNKWTMQDPHAKKEYRGTDGTIGFVSSWDSKEVGKGEQVIKNINEGERIDLGLHFIKPFEGKANAWLISEEVSGKATKLKWGMEGKNPYPFNVMNLFIDGMLGKDLEASLMNLKTILEK